MEVYLMLVVASLWADMACDTRGLWSKLQQSGKMEG